MKKTIAALCAACVLFAGCGDAAPPGEADGALSSKPKEADGASSSAAGPAAPYEAPDFHTDGRLEQIGYFGLDDATARLITNFLYLAAGTRLPPAEDFSAAEGTHPDFVMPTAIHATAPYAQNEQGDGVRLEEHALLTARLIFGDDVRTDPARAGDAFTHDAAAGTYTPTGMGYSGHVAVVLAYEDLGDRLEAECVFLTLLGDYHDPFALGPTRDGLLLGEEDIARYCDGAAPRYHITLGRRDDGTLCYLGHTFRDRGPVVLETPPAVTAGDLDTLYRNIDSFLDFGLTGDDLPELAEFYRDYLDSMAPVNEISNFQRGLEIAECDLNGDGLTDYVVAFPDTGTAGYRHTVLIREGDGGLREAGTLVTRPGGFGVMPTATNGMRDLVTEATGYRVLLRYDGEAYAFDWSELTTTRGQDYTGALYVKNGYVCQQVVFDPGWMQGTRDEGMLYYIAGVAPAWLDGFLEDGYFWAYNGDGSLYTLDGERAAPVLCARLRDGADREGVEETLRAANAASRGSAYDGVGSALFMEEILYVKRAVA